MMIDKKLDSIEEEDLQTLIANEVVEKKSLEYKSEFAIGPDKERKEFLADISSMANTIGGDIIFGIKEGMNNKPIELSGLKISNIDAEILKLENLIRDGVKPRIPRIESRAFKLKNKNFVLIVRVPKSLSSPHRVTFKAHDKFYSRSTNGKYPMDVDELRRAFLEVNSLLKEIEEFKENRIFKIYTSKTPFPLTSRTKIIMHVIPVSTFKMQAPFDLNIVRNNTVSMKPIGSGGWDTQYNINGVLTHSNDDAYCQFFKNGVFEFVSTRFFKDKIHDKTYIPSKIVADQIVSTLNQLKNLMSILDYSYPIYIFITLVGISDYWLATASQWWMQPIPHLDDILYLAESSIENIKEFELPSSEILKPTFDSLFRAYGYPNSDNLGF